MKNIVAIVLLAIVGIAIARVAVLPLLDAIDGATEAVSVASR